MKHAPRRLVSLGLLLLALAGVALQPGCATRPRTPITVTSLPPEQRARAERNLAVFHSVWDLVNRKHYQPQTHGARWEEAAAKYGPRAAAAADEPALYVVLNEMLDGLNDSHTHALSPRRALERHTHEKARTGFSMVRVEQQWVVTDVAPDSPAGGAGVSPGWIVVSRNGVPVGDQPNFNAGEGEEAVWVFRDTRDRDVPVRLVAKRLSIAALQVVRPLPDGFVYLRFDAFDAKDRRWLSRQLQEHARAPGVVIDLRRNPGGETFSLGISIGEFFDRRVDCGTFVTREGAKKVKNSWQLGSARYRGKVVVLVDATSASAAEIFAAVLQDHGRATIVGRKTAGAVLASWFYTLPDGGELQLSREDYRAPHGRRIEGHGVEPDIVVKRTLADVRVGRDPDLEAAMAVLRGR
ncbi:S41 family peptidase [Opitutus sp. ER46]|uniref:S41 family peptidase n=1 Tax=Opitutus sp. ER46 TaxID=2161864 RepID=UPI000D311703|nr:S41 family peptidase [Opitutus sp. ER46]PTX92480.1 hypothetical protein DB354_14185 [Opitutus sp. ER46]